MQGDKKICAIYCRCAQENDFAIEQQRQRLVAYARDMAYTAPALYIDNGYSAHDTERPGLDKLNADIAAGRVGVVLAKDHSRFWRDAARGMVWMARMDKLGVTVLCMDNGECQQIASDMQAAMAKLYRQHRKKKQRRHTVRTPPPQTRTR